MQNRDELANSGDEFNVYSLLKTEVLEAIIRQDAMQTGDDALDPEDILVILDVLVAREDAQGIPRKTAEDALEEFQARYMNCSPEDAVHSEKAHTPSPKKLLLPRWARLAAATAATAAFVCLGTLTAQSFGYDPWQHLYIWSKETFQFVRPDSPPSTEPSPTDTYTSEKPLAEIWKEYGFPEIMMPTQLPEGFVHTKVILSQNNHSENHSFYFNRNGQMLRVLICAFSEFSPLVQSKCDGFLETHEINGIVYFVFKNIDDVVITWMYGNYQCAISGDFSVEEAYEILNSIRRE